MNDQLKLPSLRGNLALFYDTETTGFPVNGMPLAVQPHIVQLAWVLARIPNRGEMVEVGSSNAILCLPDGADVSEGAERVHGISKYMTAECGIEPFVALHMLFEAANRATVRVAHNQQFDDRLLGFAVGRENRAECQDLKPLYYAFDDVPGLCTQALSTPIVNLSPTRRMIQAGRHHAKTAKLEEAYRHFTGQEMAGAHDAMADVRGTMTVFQHLIEAAERADENHD